MDKLVGAEACVGRVGREDDGDGTDDCNEDTQEVSLGSTSAEVWIAMLRYTHLAEPLLEHERGKEAIRDEGELLWRRFTIRLQQGRGLCLRCLAGQLQKLGRRHRR